VTLTGRMPAPAILGVRFGSGWAGKPPGPPSSGWSAGVRAAPGKTRLASTRGQRSSYPGFLLMPKRAVADEDPSAWANGGLVV